MQTTPAHLKYGKCTQKWSKITNLNQVSILRTLFRKSWKKKKNILMKSRYLRFDVCEESKFLLMIHIFPIFIAMNIVEIGWRQ